MASLVTSDRTVASSQDPKKVPHLAQGALQSQHYYLYDQVLEDRRWANTLAAIETSLMSLEIHGRIGRLGPLKSAKEMMRTALKQGVKTIVVVGTDKAIAEVINAAAGENITLGIIPIGQSDIAKILGIPTGEEACEVVAARRLQMFDLGRANNSLFLKQAEVKGKDITLTSEKNTWQITTPDNKASISVINVGPVGSPLDGQLELFINAGGSGWWQSKDQSSVIPIQKINISGANGAQIVLDGSLTINLPVTVEVVPAALKIIVGKSLYTEAN